MKTKLTNPICKPERMHTTDAGLDLKAMRAYTIKPGEAKMVDTGVAVEIPKGCTGMLTPRSSLFSKHGLLLTNSPGIIDEEYTGNIGALLLNVSHEVTHIDAGERILQLVIVPIRKPSIEIVDELDETERADGGYGSTDK